MLQSANRFAGDFFDRWTEGPAFNFGWDLLVPTPLQFDEIMSGVAFIWISHEHPDHFSPAFLSQVAKTRADRVTVLFQETRDKRVIDFCKARGLKVRELKDKETMRLTDKVTVKCGAADLFDLWLYLSDGCQSILNLNDVLTPRNKDVDRIAGCVGQPTVLLSQFGYASWKGGRDNQDYRAAAARQKLETLARQIKILQPRYTLPFASLIYFSNEENNYLNDHLNTPAKAALVIQEAGSKPIILYPGDYWRIETGACDNRSALARYEQLYNDLDALPLRSAGRSCSVEELKAAFQIYRNRVLAKNSAPLISLIRSLPLLKVFKPISIEIYDIKKQLSFSLSGLDELSSNERVLDVRMHSSSLMFLLKNEFGFDTLMVNGRFELTPEGFSRMTKTLAIGSLNAMGLSLSLKLLTDFKVIVILLKGLWGVLDKVRSIREASKQASQSAIAASAVERGKRGQ